MWHIIGMGSRVLETPLSSIFWALADQYGLEKSKFLRNFYDIGSCHLLASEVHNITFPLKTEDQVTDE